MLEININRSSSFLLMVIYSIAIIWCFSTILSWFKRRRKFIMMASKIPGPPTIPIFGNALLLASNPQDIINTVLKLSETYKGVFRVWLGNRLGVVINKASDIECVLGNTKQFSKSRQYDVFRPLMGNGLFTSSNHELWKFHRKLLTPAFHFSILKGFLTIFFQEATILADKLESNLDKSIDIYPFVALCTLDAICRTAIGVSVKAQYGNGGDFVHSLATVFTVWQKRITTVWLNIPIFFALTSSKRKHDKAVKSALSFTDKIINEKYDEWKQNKELYFKKLEDGGKLAFLDLMLGNGMTNEQLRDETMTIIIAGLETTATELSFALLMLALHVDIQRKVQEELAEVFGEDSRTEPNLADLNKLEYMERVIKETLRMFPALPAAGRRMDADCKLESCVIPKGTDVGVFIFGCHRDPGSWNEPNVFNPDNFLPENCRTRHPYAFLPFSAGLRNCIGQKYSMLQMKSVLSTLLRRFKLRTGPELRSIDDIEVIMSTTLKTKNGFNVIVEKR